MIQPEETASLDTPLALALHNLAEVNGVASDLSEVMIHRFFELLEDIDANRLKFTRQISDPYSFENDFVSGHLIDGFELIKRDDASSIILTGYTKLCSFTPKTGCQITPGQIVSITLNEPSTGDSIEFQIGRYNNEENQFLILNYRNSQMLIDASDFVFDAYCKIFDFHNDINDEVQFPTLPRRISRRDV